MGWLSGWAKRRKITIDNTKIDAILTWFPVLVKISVSCGKNSQDLTNIFSEVLGNSQKIAITKSDGTTELYAEIEKWNYTGTPATSEAYLWVSQDGWAIDNNTDTDFYIYYDNTHANNSNIGLLADGSVATIGVWDGDFILVYHLAKTGVHPEDSTSYGNDATASQLVGRGVAGAIDGEADFEKNNSDYIREGVGSGDSLKQAFMYLTLEAWCKLESATILTGVAGRWDPPSNQRSYAFAEQTNPLFTFQVTKNGQWTTGNRSSVTDGVNSTGVQYHYMGTWDGSKAAANCMKLYRNGVDVSVVALSEFNGPIHAGTRDFLLGAHWKTQPTMYRYYDGRMDEVRVSKINRSIAYAKATHSTGTDILLSFGAEEICTIPTVITNNATFIGDEEATLNGTVDDTGADPTVDERGFDWGTETGVYPNSWTETGAFGTGSFSREITGLSHGTTIYFRAKAHNSSYGWGYGSELSFVTKVVFIITTTPTTGITFDKDGTPYDTPYTVEVDVNTSYVITMPYEQVIGGVKYRFVKWDNDSTNRIRTVDVTTTDKTVTAMYIVRYTLGVESLPSGILFQLERV